MAYTVVEIPSPASQFSGSFTRNFKVINDNLAAKGTLNFTEQTKVVNEVISQTGIDFDVAYSATYPSSIVTDMSSRPMSEDDEFFWVVSVTYSITEADDFSFSNPPWSKPATCSISSAGRSVNARNNYIDQLAPVPVQSSAGESINFGQIQLPLANITFTEARSSSLNVLSVLLIVGKINNAIETICGVTYPKHSLLFTGLGLSDESFEGNSYEQISFNFLFDPKLHVRDIVDRGIHEKFANTEDPPGFSLFLITDSHGNNINKAFNLKDGVARRDSNGFLTSEDPELIAVQPYQETSFSPLGV